MGAWGPGIFSDDEAADVRDNFKLYVADRQDISTATDAIASDYGASLDEPEHNTAFWLGLALTQWNAGWLDPRARAAAFRVIDDGSDLVKWEHSGQRSSRTAALRAARERLESTPPKSKPFPRPWPTQLADFEIGEIIGRRLPNRRLIVMKVIGFRPSHEFKVRGPAVRVQHWLAMEMPTDEEARSLEYLRHPLGPEQDDDLWLAGAHGATLLSSGPRSVSTDWDQRPGRSTRRKNQLWLDFQPRTRDGRRFRSGNGALLGGSKPSSNCAAAVVRSRQRKSTRKKISNRWHFALRKLKKASEAQYISSWSLSPA